MASLKFKSILATGNRNMGEGAGPGGTDMLDWFRPSINLPGFVDLPALLMIATKKADYGRNFITFNAPPLENPWGVQWQGYEDARDEDYFVSRILRNSGNTWIEQFHRVPGGLLTGSGDILGIHARNEDGEPSGNRDNFSVARIFLLYFAS